MRLDIPFNVGDEVYYVDWELRAPTGPVKVRDITVFVPGPTIAPPTLSPAVTLEKSIRYAFGSGRAAYDFNGVFATHAEALAESRNENAIGLRTSQ